MAGFTWNEQEVQFVLYGAEGPVVRFVERLTGRTRDACESLCPKRTGQTSRSFRTEVRVEGQTVTGRVWSEDPVVRWLEEGTGIFGPTGRRIFPVRARVLRWEDRGQVFYAPSVAGMRAQPFMKRALTVGARPFPVRDGR
ncbi:HK97 gp10 family phage protein [Streptomyces yaizuensis]|uniref:HK97 gp10 family phage protein n=1 Tax=Streptomyces yaizuensis TaxID=2989713 RepID=A0AA86JGD7_9ACTN|nr:HK97 gp10 family phage protein [Streptomyces sp. YSPA8]BDT39529.1 HK97 gp10 family phage protein [Streptomyces sp. YSPA8]